MFDNILELCKGPFKCYVMQWGGGAGRYRDQCS